MKKTPGESQGNGFNGFVRFMRDTGNAVCKGARQAPIISSYFDMLDDLAKLINEAKGEDGQRLKKKLHAFFHKENLDATIAFVLSIAGAIGFDHGGVEIIMLFFASVSGILADYKATKIVEREQNEK